MSAIAHRESGLLREAGALAALPTSLTALALSTAWKGDLVGSGQVIAEKDDVEAATGDRQPPYASLCLLALQGREEESTKASEQALELAAARGQDMATPWTQWTAAVLRNGLGRYKEALIAAREVTSKPSNWWLLWVWPELVEAAVRVGEPDIAREGLDRLAESTQASGTDFALGVEARCRALLSEGTLAEELYEEAIERLDRTHLRPELARTHLVYGEWLRRSSRRNDAREHLRTAYRMFHEMGMAGFAERAWLELHATGEKGTPRLAPVGDELTAQEQRIARLASEGLSNTEIGERLFLSSRTVEWHLNHVYRKLGIRSRREIPHALSDADSRNLP
jgi:DNA-binding CsgD family transcriptional regulator